MRDVLAITYAGAVAFFLLLLVSRSPPGASLLHAAELAHQRGAFAPQLLSLPDGLARRLLELLAPSCQPVQAVLSQTLTSIGSAVSDTRLALLPCIASISSRSSAARRERRCAACAQQAPSAPS